MECSVLDCRKVRKEISSKTDLKEIGRQLDKCNRCVFADDSAQNGKAYETAKRTRGEVGALYSVLFFASR